MANINPIGVDLSNGTMRVLGADDSLTASNGISLNSVQFSAPNFDSFSWINQGAATQQSVTRVAGGAVFALLTAPVATEPNLRLLLEALPPTPYAVELGFYRTTLESNFNRCGIAVRDSASGRIVVAGSNSSSWAIQKFNTATSFNSDYNAQTAWNAKIGNAVFLRLDDNGTNFIWSYGWDGFTWITMNTQSRTNFLASPNQIGISFNSNSNSQIDKFTIFHYRSGSGF